MTSFSNAGLPRAVSRVVKAHGVLVGEVEGDVVQRHSADRGEIDGCQVHPKQEPSLPESLYCSPKMGPPERTSRTGRPPSNRKATALVAVLTGTLDTAAAMAPDRNPIRLIGALHGRGRCSGCHARWRHSRRN